MIFHLFTQLLFFQRLLIDAFYPIFQILWGFPVSCGRQVGQLRTDLDRVFVFLYLLLLLGLLHVGLGRLVVFDLQNPPVFRIDCKGAGRLEDVNSFSQGIEVEIQEMVFNGVRLPVVDHGQLELVDFLADEGDPEELVLEVNARDGKLGRQFEGLDAPAKSEVPNLDDVRLVDRHQKAPLLDHRRGHQDRQVPDQVAHEFYLEVPVLKSQQKQGDVVRVVDEDDGLVAPGKQDLLDPLDVQLHLHQNPEGDRVDQGQSAVARGHEQHPKVLDLQANVDVRVHRALQDFADASNGFDFPAHSNVLLVFALGVLDLLLPLLVVFLLEVLFVEVGYFGLHCVESVELDFKTKLRFFFVPKVDVLFGWRKEVELLLEL